MASASEYLEQLIPFPSVSSQCNDDISDWLQRSLEQLDFEVERLHYPDPAGVRKACLVGRKGPAVGRGLAYFCHTDVVPVNSWSFPHAGPWTPHRTPDRIYGRGSCDMRGSAACMLSAAQEFSHSELVAPLYFVATADEEVGMGGAIHVAKSSAVYREIVAHQSRSIIGEPTRLEVVHAHKGGRAVKAVSIGRAAHSSTGLGLNANLALIPFLHELSRIHQEMESAPFWRDDRFSPPTPTMNIVINDTNTGVNITSAQSEVTAYFRPMPGQDADSMVQRMRGFAEECGLRFSVVFSGEPLYTEPDNPFVQEMLELTSPWTGSDVPRTAAYGTDGAIFTELRDIVVCGPGDIAQAHTDDEWISLEQLRRGTDLYRECIRRWCC